MSQVPCIGQAGLELTNLPLIFLSVGLLLCGITAVTLSYKSEKVTLNYKSQKVPGVVAHAFNPSTRISDCGVLA
ncbi:hypothetical protein ACQP3L_35995, partial [Escherichia coli]